MLIDRHEVSAPHPPSECHSMGSPAGMVGPVAGRPAQYASLARNPFRFDSSQESLWLATITYRDSRVEARRSMRRAQRAAGVDSGSTRRTPRTADTNCSRTQASTPESKCGAARASPRYASPTPSRATLGRKGGEERQRKRVAAKKASRDELVDSIDPFAFGIGGLLTRYARKPTTTWSLTKRDLLITGTQGRNSVITETQGRNSR